MFGKVLNVTQEEKDLGIIVDAELKFHRQATSAAAKANQLLGIVRRSFANLSLQSLPVLYKTLIRPHLEYGNRIWGPMAVGDQKLLERVQRRATKLVAEVRMKPYSQRLKELQLPSLTYRRSRGDHYSCIPDAARTSGHGSGPASTLNRGSNQRTHIQAEEAQSSNAD